MKKILISLAAVLVFNSFTSSAFAISSVLPQPKGDGWDITDLNETECAEIVDAFETDGEFVEGQVKEGTTVGDLVFACAIKSGNIKFWMIPYFVRNILQWLLALSGLIAVLMVIIGGYYYIMGGLTEDKEKGKTIITYALGGMALATLSWIIVNVILLAVTS